MAAVLAVNSSNRADARIGNGRAKRGDPLTLLCSTAYEQIVDPIIAAIAALGLAAVANFFFLLRLSRQPAAPPSFPPMPPPSNAPLDLNAAMETILVKSMDSQAGMLERINKLNAENATLAVDLLTRRGAIRAGKARAAKGRRDSKGRMASNCRLCANPMIHDPTSAEIISHSVHRAGGNLKITEEGKAVTVHLPESEVLTAPDGSQQIEDDCVECGGRLLDAEQRAEHQKHHVH